MGANQFLAAKIKLTADERATLESYVRRRKTAQALALRARGQRPQLRKVLVQIRNNFASHYDQPKALAQGFEHYFFGPLRDGHRGIAYYAAGDPMSVARLFTPMPRRLAVSATERRRTRSRISVKRSPTSLRCRAWSSRASSSRGSRPMGASLDD